jgi:hypothetical protein
MLIVGTRVPFPSSVPHFVSDHWAKTVEAVAININFIFRVEFTLALSCWDTDWVQSPPRGPPRESWGRAFLLSSRSFCGPSFGFGSNSLTLLLFFSAQFSTNGLLRKTLMVRLASVGYVMFLGIVCVTLMLTCVCDGALERKTSTPRKLNVAALAPRLETHGHSLLASDRRVGL